MVSRSVDAVTRARAAYRLNAEMHDLLGVEIIRLIVRGETVIGHYGRHGYVRGVLRGQELTAALRDDLREGSLAVTFDDDFASFDGYYAPAMYDTVRRYPCSGRRVARRRNAGLREVS
jgi:hypothetical protein